MNSGYALVNFGGLELTSESKVTKQVLTQPWLQHWQQERQSLQVVFWYLLKLLHLLQFLRFLTQQLPQLLMYRSVSM